MKSQNGLDTTSQPITHPRASLIISTWNGRPLLETCLPRVLRAVEQAGGEHEVIVVDDASTDDTVDFVRREFPQVRLLALARNLRFAGANNAAAHAATGDLLLFLNNDMLVEPDFLPPLLRHFEDPDVFAVTAHIQMPPRERRGGLIRETGLVRGRFEDGFFALHHEDPQSTAAAPVIYAGGGSSAWRRDRFLALGGFDTLFRPFYFEDLDVSYRAQKHGWRLLFEPASRLEHKHQQTNNPTSFPPGFVELCFEKSHLLFTWKVITDPDLVAQHFRALRRRLLQSEPNSLLRRAFLQAAKQLPELLRRRRQGRVGVVLTDREVFARAGGGAVAPSANLKPRPEPASPPPPEVKPSLPLRAAALVGKAVVIRRATEPWGLDPAEPPQRVLVLRAGSLSLTARVVEAIHQRYPAANVTVLAPGPVAEETRREVAALVVAATNTRQPHYRITRDLVRDLHAGRFDTIYVAGEGNRRAEALALLTGARKVEVRDDGAAHVFSLAPHKPILVAAGFISRQAQAAALTALVGIVWGALALEGRTWLGRRSEGL